MLIRGSSIILPKTGGLIRVYYIRYDIISAGHEKKSMRKGHLDGGDRHFVTTFGKTRHTKGGNRA